MVKIRLPAGNNGSARVGNINFLSFIFINITYINGVYSQQYAVKSILYYLCWASLFPLARWEEDQRPVVWVPHLGVDVFLQLWQTSVVQSLQHHFVGNLKNNNFTL